MNVMILGVGIVHILVFLFVGGGLLAGGGVVPFFVGSLPAPWWLGALRWGALVVVG